MTDKQPVALLLAEMMESGKWQGMNDLLAAAELRRLHEVNAELVEALKEAAENIADWGSYASEYFQNKHDLQGDIDKVNAVIAKAEGK